MRCDWHTSRYCHVRLGLCSWACELIPMASKSTPPPTLLQLYPGLSAALSSFSRFFHFTFSHATSQRILTEPCGKPCSSANRHRVKIQQQVQLVWFSKTNLCSLINSVQKGHPQVRASQCTKKQPVFWLGTPHQMTRQIERNKGRLTEERKTNCEAGYGETSGRRNRD